MRSPRFSLVAAAAVAAACGPGSPGNGSGEGEAAADAATSVDEGTSAEASEASSSTGSGTVDSTSESSTSNDVSGTQGTSDSGFVDEPDMPLASCNITTQDCPEGEKCSAYVSEPGYCCVDSNGCVPIVGDRQYGESCTRDPLNDDCAAGLFCMTSPTSGSTGEGTCLEICGSQFTCTFGNQCLTSGDGTLPLCIEYCDPLVTNDCASSSLMCAPAGTSTPEGVPAWGCRPTAAAPGEGEACVGTCAPGLVCLQADSFDAPACPVGADKCCASLCDLSATDACVGPNQCRPWGEVSGQPDANEPPWEQVGACVL